MNDDSSDQQPGTDPAATDETAAVPAAGAASVPAAGGSGSARNLEVVLDIPVRLSMEIGATSVSIRRLLQLNRGSILELDQVAGEPLEIFANGTLVAHGEVVVVNDRYGIKLLDVVSPQERIERLN